MHSIWQKDHMYYYFNTEYCVEKAIITHRLQCRCDKTKA